MMRNIASQEALFLKLLMQKPKFPCEDLGALTHDGILGHFFQNLQFVLLGLRKFQVE